MKRPLILVTGPTRPDPNVADDAAPRQDHREIARALDADMIGYDRWSGAWYRWARQAQRRIRLDVVEAVAATGWSREHSYVISTSEKVAIPLAALAEVTGWPRRHVVVGTSSPRASRSRCCAARGCGGTSPRRSASAGRRPTTRSLSSAPRPDRVHVVPDKVDQRFFRPLGRRPRTTCSRSGRSGGTT